jgi:3-oxoacyl-[acyl-carrier protein] reductase
MDLMLRGKRALVTSATRGLGLAMAERLATEGANVAICSRNEENVRAAVTSLSAHGTNIWGGVADVGNPVDYLSWIRSAVEALGGCDIFIFNSSAEATNGSDEAWQQSMEIDLLGAKRGVEALEAELVSHKGAILFTASVAAVEQMIGPFPYNAVKAALLNYAKNLSASLGPRGVRVNCVSPGPIRYPGGAWERVEQGAPDFYAGMLARTDLGNFGSAEDIGSAAAFLVSPVAKFITGINLLVDGGTSGHVGG